jgi:two-component system cell cycle sensor histidine kinase/response regulator CckA
LPGGRILVVEDEAIVAGDIKGRLETMGYEVVGTASTADDAVKKAGSFSPELALMDIRLAGNADGIEAAGVLRRRYDIPSIFITAYADEETLTRARATEPLGYLVKPFQDRELHATIEMALYRHQAERAVRASELRFRTLVQLAPDAIVMTDGSGGIALWNRAAESMLGSGLSEMTGRPLAGLLGWEAMGSGMGVMDGLAQKGSIRNLELSVPVRGGEAVPVEMSATVLRDDRGRSTGQVFIWRDISERKRAEKQRTRLQLELLQAQKLSAIGELAAGVAHELNNPLTGILLYSALSLRKLNASDPERSGYLEKLPRDLEMIRDSALRCDRIVKGLLDFSRRDPPKKEPLDINVALKNSVGMLSRYLEAQRIKIVENLGADLPHVEGDENTLRQVFVNIIRNAQDAMPDGGALTIVSRMLDAGRIEIAVTDTGTGISEQNKSKLFQPFFTTKPPGKGTGLGLAISYGIVHDHGGTIGVESTEGKGTTFRLVFPAATAPGGKKDFHESGGGAG